jgi:hypothetical protein
MQETNLVCTTCGTEYYSASPKQQVSTTCQNCGTPCVALKEEK